MVNIFESWWFDPLTATIGFAIPLYLYTYLEVQSGTSIYKSFYDSLFGKGINIEDQRRSLPMSVISYWIGVTLWVQVVPKPGGGHIPDGIPDSIQSLIILVLEVISGIILYDATFFFLHWMMHECKVLSWMFHSHKEHHRTRKILEARHVLRHSLFDGILQVLVNIFVQRYTPWGSVKSKAARALHNFIVTWMLTESHTSTDKLNIFRKYFVGVREHRNHHLSSSSGGNNVPSSARHQQRYQQFFGYLDDIRLYVKEKRKNI